MGFKSLAARPFAFFIHKKLTSDSKKAVDVQNEMLFSHLKKAENTLFGKKHEFERISTYEDYKEAVPIKDYEELKTYFDKIADGKKDVLWPGLPKYLAKTSGTTSGAKYIPITADSLPNHFGTARNAVFNFAHQSGNFKFMDGKMMFLSGSPELTKTNGILTGRLSGISNHLIPNWLKRNQLPSYETNTIEEWEPKLDKIVEETLRVDMRLISGIPPWVQMYFERLLEVSGAQNVVEVFPNFSIFVYGGVNYEPYRLSLEKLIGKSIDSVETYPASEGFIAFQDRPGDTGLMLNINSGIFFEFVPLREIDEEHPSRLKLDQVEVDTDYALILTSNAGLWAYNLGDTVRFLSLDPPRIQVSGRTKNYISAFGEHVISKEVEEAIQDASEKTGAKVVEFTVAPQVKPPEGGAPYHEWFIEFGESPEDLQQFSDILNRQMVDQNIYYKDLIDGKILRPLEVRELSAHAFRNFMKSRGKLGGQNKVPRLSNNRKIADELEEYISS